MRSAFVRHALALGPLFIVGSISVTELVVALAATAHGWWVLFLASNAALLLLLHGHVAQEEETAAVMLEVTERQNLALADALRLADVLRSMVARQRKADSIERARAALRRGSRSAGDLED